MILPYNSAFLHLAWIRNKKKLMCPVVHNVYRILTGVSWTRKSNLVSIFIHAGYTVQSWHTSGVANATGYSASAKFFPAIWSLLRWNNYTTNPINYWLSSDALYVLQSGCWERLNNNQLNFDGSHTSSV